MCASHHSCIRAAHSLHPSAPAAHLEAPGHLTDESSIYKSQTVLSSEHALFVVSVCACVCARRVRGFIKDLLLVQCVLLSAFHSITLSLLYILFTLSSLSFNHLIIAFVVFHSITLSFISLSFQSPYHCVRSGSCTHQGRQRQL